MKFLALAAGFLLLAPRLEAVLVFDGTAANLVAPLDDPGWNSIGRFTTYVATAVFLGNYGGSAWFLTANHFSVSGNSLEIAEQTFTDFYDQQQIGTADLKVFRLNTTLTGLTPITLASTAPESGDPVVMMGNGRTGTKVIWNTSTNPWTEGGSDAEGYTWSSPNVLRWGTSSVQDVNLIGSGTVYFSTDFGPTAGQAQGSLGDSGGAVFTKKSGSWELAGIMLAVGVLQNGTYQNNFLGQPSQTAVASIASSPGDRSVTFSAQIANYSGAILAAIPEPSTWILLLIGGSACWLRRRDSSHAKRKSRFG